MIEAVLGVGCSAVVFVSLLTSRRHRPQLEQLRVCKDPIIKGPRDKRLIATHALKRSKIFAHINETLERRKMLAQVEKDLSITVDLFHLCIKSGLNVHRACEYVASSLDGPIAQQFQTALREVEVGLRMTEALERIADRTGDSVRPFVAAVATCELYGAPLSHALELLANEARMNESQRFERQARKLSVQLLFPLAVCTLPAFIVLTIAPTLAGSLIPLAASF